MRFTPIAIATAAMLVGAALVKGAPAAAPSPAPIGAARPRGIVSFFTTNLCPEGWAPVTLAAGRILVGTESPQAVGHVVGDALAAGEDRGHGHGVSGLVSLPAKNIAGADGGNQSGAGSGTQLVIGDAAPAPSGMPFIQLAACVQP
jgi:hypothetical protein